MRHNNIFFKAIAITLISLTALLTSCYPSTMVVSKKSFDNAILETEQSFNEMGFYKNGISTNKNTDITKTTGIVYMPNVGIVPYTSEDKNETTIETYSFSDTIGNTVNYSIAYKMKESHDGISYVENTDVISRVASNPNQYDKVFGVNSPVNKLQNIPKNDVASVYDEEKSMAALLGGTIVGGCFLFLLILAF